MDTAPKPGATIWIDVEDFLYFFRYHLHPSGIQRLAFEIKQALLETGAAPRVRFARRGPDGTLVEVAWADIAALMGGERAPAPSTPALGDSARAGMLQFINGLPSHLRGPLFRAGLLQLHAARKLREAARSARLRRKPAVAGPGPDPVVATPAPVQPGDRYLVLGAPWAVTGFPAFLSRLKERHGVVAHLLIYDLIPVRNPEWTTAETVELFEAWLEGSLALFDGVLAISRYTARDVENYAAERGIPLAGPVRPVPIGTGFGGAATADGALPGLPPPGSYVLFVSTLEVRKNHALLFRVWRKLDDEVRAGRRPASSVPTLVFAGRPGWLVSDLLQQLENARWLDGRIRFLRDPSDAELETLYRNCLFTVFPSWFEGWGLPVTESLAFGKPCLASAATALPEAGGALCRYFDPGDVGGTHRAIASALDDRRGLAEWEARVRREFRVVPWSESARAVLDAVGA